MKTLERMSLEEILEYGNKQKVLSEMEFYDRKIPVYKSYEQYRSNFPIRKELKRLYDNLLDDIAQEINNSNIDKNPLDIALLVGNYLLPLGLFSYTNKFHYINKDNLWSVTPGYLDYNTLTLQGTYAVCGYGCCRHINSFIADLFRKLEIKVDKIPCFQGMVNVNDEINENFIVNNFEHNHLIIGYISDNEYHLIDPYNQIYSFVDERFYYSYSSLKSNQRCIIFPDFIDNLYQKQTYWAPYIPYQTYDNDDINERKNKIFRILDDGDIKKFIKFKITHFDIMQKIAYLTPMELERTQEKENQKRKRI